VTAPPTVVRRFDPRRLYTAAILIPTVYAIISYLPPWTLTLLLIVGGGLALVELYRITLTLPLNRWLVAVGLSLASLVLARHALSLLITDLLLIGAWAMLVSLFLASGSFHRRLKETALVSFGVLYVGATLSTIVSTRLLSGGERFVIFLALVTWSGDTGAYYIGTLFGKHLLAPSISPKKTVEGALGGLALAESAALVGQMWLVPEFSLIDTLALGFLLTVAGLLGDLWESAIKRRAGVKDSGSILPGHGGMLDRLDSLLFTAPAFYYYVTYFRGLGPSP
jgi:phosphatidate cytidylyltransferase